MSNQTVPVKPLGNRLILRRDDAEKVSEGGILIPEQAQERPARGTVVAVGNGKRLGDGRMAAMSVDVGDSVLFAKWAGDEIEHEGETLLLLGEADVVAVIEAASAA